MSTWVAWRFKRRVTDSDLTVAELILVLCGTVLLIEPLVTMLTNHVKDHVSPRDEKKRSRMSRILS